MKHFAAVLLCFLSLFPSLVSANPVGGASILSQNYSVSGTYSYEWDVGDSTPVLYSQGSGSFGGSTNDGNPLSISYAVPSPPGTFPYDLFGTTFQSANHVDYNLDTFAFQFGSLSLRSAWPLRDPNNVLYTIVSSFITSSAQGTWLFQPTSGNQQITLHLTQSGSFFYDQNLAVMLSDLTDGSTLLDYSYGFGFQALGNVDQTSVFPLNSGDQYQLSVVSQSNIYDGDHLTQLVSASVGPVPEPSLTVLLPAALMGVLVSRKNLHQPR